jgi:alpha-tubulin suppressor-like RCC1 family protein
MLGVRRLVVCSVLAPLLAVVGSGLLTAANAAGAGTPAGTASKPVISGLTATPSKLTAAGESSTISATVSGAPTCKVSSFPALLAGSGALSCAGGTLSDVVLFPTSTTPVVYTVIVTAKGKRKSTTMTVEVKVRQGAGGGIAGVSSMASDGEGSCALLTSSAVDCWGYGPNGQLGNGQFYTSGPDGSASPVQVVGESGTGTLAGVSSLIGDESSNGYCALLTSSDVDCWGFGQVGDLGDALFSDSAIPVQVQGVGGSGVLTGVSSVAGDGLGYCAVLSAGGAVDCWGYGPNGELGDGQFYSSSPFGSATPVQVVDVDGSGVLFGVLSVTGGEDGYCALLLSGGVDCWGGGNSATPVPVEGVGGNGDLSGVSSVTSDATGGYCALLSSGAVDCWGPGGNGELGNGQFSDSATPVQVQGVRGSGALSGVSSVTNDEDGYCAALTSGGVDCWGNGTFGILGDGQFSDSATPVQVDGIAGSGLLHQVSGLISDGNGFCAALTSSEVDCWGAGADGDLGNGKFYSGSSGGSANPVQVDGVGGVGALSGVAGVTGSGDGYCAVLTSSEVDCWGAGDDGKLGNGQFYSANPPGSATPVEVL